MANNKKRRKTHQTTKNTKLKTMSTSKFDGNHHFIFQHRDLVWMWHVSNEQLMEHKNKVLPKVEKRKWCGIDKITNAFTDYDNKEFELDVVNGCIEHAFAMKGDITLNDERVHWLYISNGENGRFLEMDELEDKKFQISYLSKSFKDEELPNLNTIISWGDAYEECENNDNFGKERSDKVYGMYRTLFLCDVLRHVLRDAGIEVSQKTLTDKRDVFVYNELFNNTQFHINQLVKNEMFKSVCEEFECEKMHKSLIEMTKKNMEFAIKVYKGDTLFKHIEFSFYNTFDRDMRMKIRSDKQCLKYAKQIISNPEDNADTITKLFQKLG